jgi:hypothetical protein
MCRDLRGLTLLWGVTKALGIEVTWNACILDLDDHVRPTFGGKEPSVVFCDKNTGPGIVGVSAEERERDSCDDLTLRQCLMLNLGIYMMCGKYPGDNAKVLCAGSRTSRGEVPVVFYDGEKHKVHIFEKPVKFKAMELGLYKIVRADPAVTRLVPPTPRVGGIFLLYFTL